MKLAVRSIVGFLAAALATIMTMTTAEAAPAPYTIQFVTCDVIGAGTDARVEARLNGTISSSPWLPFDGENEEFERGRTDTYSFVTPHLGPIQSVDIAFDNMGGADHWCLEEVIVRGPDGVTVHPYHNWLRRKCTRAAPLRLPAA